MDCDCPLAVSRLAPASATPAISSSAAATPLTWRCRFGTPLYVFDEETVRRQCRATWLPLPPATIPSSVFYAGKAYLGVKLAQHHARRGPGPRCRVGRGDARGAGRPASRRSESMSTATTSRQRSWQKHSTGALGALSSTTWMSWRLLSGWRPSAGRRRTSCCAWRRPSTRTPIATLPPAWPTRSSACPSLAAWLLPPSQAALASPRLRLRGYHVHIGSQIHDLDAYRQAVDALMQLCGADTRRAWVCAGGDQPRRRLGSALHAGRAGAAACGCCCRAGRRAERRLQPPWAAATGAGC